MKTTKTMFVVEEDYDYKLSVISVELTITDKISKFKSSRATAWRSQLPNDQVAYTFSETPELAAQRYVDRLVKSIASTKQTVYDLECKLTKARTELKPQLLQSK